MYSVRTLAHSFFPSPDSKELFYSSSVYGWGEKNFYEAKIKRIPPGIHKTFAGAKIKLASCSLQIKLGFIALRAVLLRLAAHGIFLSASDMLVRIAQALS